MHLNLDQIFRLLCEVHTLEIEDDESRRRLARMKSIKFIYQLVTRDIKDLSGTKFRKNLQEALAKHGLFIGMHVPEVDEMKRLMLNSINTAAANGDESMGFLKDKVDSWMEQEKSKDDEFPN